MTKFQPKKIKNKELDKHNSKNKITKRLVIITKIISIFFFKIWELKQNSKRKMISAPQNLKVLSWNKQGKEMVGNNDLELKNSCNKYNKRKV